jgi:hypothetical protein
LKVFITCPICLENPEGDFFELSDSSYYPFECRNGHKTAYWLQAIRFELLIDTGLWALELSFPDLAVIRFYTALEDFKRFFTQSWLCQNGVDWESSNHELKKLLRSEMQKGAYSLAFGLVKQKFPENAPAQLDEQALESLRNKIVHGGKFVSTAEAKKYCQTILTYISDTLDWSHQFLKEGMFEAQKAIMLAESKKFFSNNQYADYRNGTVSMPKVVDISRSRSTRLTVDEGIALLKNSGCFIKP